MAIGGANELDDTIDYSQTYEFQPPDVLNAIPVKRIISALRVRLDADKARDASLTVGFVIPDTEESCAVQLRRGVAVIHDSIPGTTDATITIDPARVHELSRDFANASAVLTAASHVTNEDKAREFFSYFDPLPTQPAKIVTR